MTIRLENFTLPQMLRQRAQQQPNRAQRRTARLVRSIAPTAALTLGAGTSGGTVAPQRLWYLGGAETVRGQPAGAP